MLWPLVYPTLPAVDITLLTKMGAKSNCDRPTELPSASNHTLGAHKPAVAVHLAVLSRNMCH